MRKAELWQSRHRALKIACDSIRKHSGDHPRASKRRCGGGYCRTMTKGRAHRGSWAQATLAVATMLLFLLQSFSSAVAASRLGAGEPGHRAGASASLAKGLCAARGESRDPTERHELHAKCCAICCQSRDQDELRLMAPSRADRRSVRAPVSPARIAHLAPGPPKESAPGRLSRAPRAPPFVS
jgi:hypothetical protein